MSFILIFAPLEESTDSGGANIAWHLLLVEPLYVNLQLLRLDECSRTEWTLAGSLSCVDPLMPFQTGCEAETLPAVFTHIWSFTSVDPLVRFQVTSMRECRATDVTDMRLLTCMD